MSIKSIRATLATALSIALLAGTGAASAETLRIGGTGVALGGMKHLGRAFETRNPDITVEVLPSLGSSGGIKALVAGAIDLSVSSRPLKDAEAAQGAEAQLYATTPLAIVTSRGTQSDGLSTEQLARMYAGTMPNWPTGERVRVVLRPPSESDIKILRSLSEDMASAMDTAMDRPGLVMATNDQNNAETLENLPGSIGAVALGQIASEGRNLKVLTLDGAMPGDDSGAFSKGLYLVSTQAPIPAAEAFTAFVFSPEGREILEALDHASPR